MSKRATVYIGELGGIPLYVHSSWLVVFALFLYVLTTEVLPMFERGRSLPYLLGEAVAATLLIYGTVIVHELAHALVARAQGLGVREITLYVFGGAAMLEREPGTPRAEFLMAIAGPLTSFAFAAAFYLAANLAYSAGASAASVVCSVVALVNLYLGEFNLTPAFPLDGGRIVRAFLWTRTKERLRATVLAVRGTWAVAAAAFAYAAALLVRGDFGGVWLGFIATVVLVAARNSLQYAVLEAAWNSPIERYALRVPTITARDVREGRVPDNPPAVVVNGAILGVLTGANGGMRVSTDFVVCAPGTPAIDCLADLEGREREYAVVAPAEPFFDRGWALLVTKARLKASVERAARLKIPGTKG